jgi:hypothetical protein
MSRARVHRVTRVIAPVLAVATAGVIARADAPPDQYASFNQADTVITDNFTKLNWQRTVTTSTDFAGAIAECNGLSLGTFSSGWRLPSYKELLTLVDESPHDEYPTGQAVQVAIDGNAFPETPNGSFWTSSVVPSSGSILDVEFKQGTGNTLLPIGANAYVRCVHNPM